MAEIKLKKQFQGVKNLNEIPWEKWSLTGLNEGPYGQPEAQRRTKINFDCGTVVALAPILHVVNQMPGGLISTKGEMECMIFYDRGTEPVSTTLAEIAAEL